MRSGSGAAGSGRWVLPSDACCCIIAGVAQVGALSAALRKDTRRGASTASRGAVADWGARLKNAAFLLIQLVTPCTLLAQGAPRVAVLSLCVTAGSMLFIRNAFREGWGTANAWGWHAMQVCAPNI